MIDDQDFTNFEDHLRSDAARLSELPVRTLSGDDIRHVQVHQRRAIVLRSSAALTACLLVALIAKTALDLRQGHVRQANSVPPINRNERVVPESSLPPSTVPFAAAVSTNNDDGFGPADSISNDLLDSAYQFQMIVPGPDGPIVIGTGVYVPSQVEQVDLIDMSPAQQSAVIKVLEMREDELIQDPI